LRLCVVHVQMGYNLLFGLWKYSWDADCDLFLKILKDEVKEDVYVQQIALQEELSELFVQLDKAKGQETGIVLKVSRAPLRVPGCGQCACL
jgi:hypothetical protein